MKKILGLVLLATTITLTGCSESKVSLADVNDVITRVGNYENVVVIDSEIEERDIKEYSNSKTSKWYEETVYIHTFWDNFYMVESEYYAKNTMGTSYVKSKTSGVTIYDFSAGVKYTSSGETGLYSQTSFNSDYYDFNYYYSRNVSTSFLSGFTGSTFKTEYEVEYHGYKCEHSIYGGRGDNLTYEKNTEYDDDYSTYYYDYDREIEEIYSITFKDSKIKVPSTKNLLY